MTCSCKTPTDQLVVYTLAHGNQLAMLKRHTRSSETNFSSLTFAEPGLSDGFIGIQKQLKIHSFSLAHSDIKLVPTAYANRMLKLTSVYFQFIKYSPRNKTTVYYCILCFPVRNTFFPVLKIMLIITTLPLKNQQKNENPNRF